MNDPRKRNGRAGAMIDRPALRTSNPSRPLLLTERIRVRAYELYRARGGAPGDAVSDWLRAEREIASAVAGRAAPGRADAGPDQAILDAHNEARGNAILHVSDA